MSKVTPDFFSGKGVGNAATPERVHIFVDRDLEAPSIQSLPALTEDPGVAAKMHYFDRPTVAVTRDATGETLTVCRKVLLTGPWVLRQYRHPVDCGATVVLLPLDVEPRLGSGPSRWEQLT